MRWGRYAQQPVAWLMKRRAASYAAIISEEPVALLKQAVLRSLPKFPASQA